MAVEKGKWLQVRMAGHERDVLDELARNYNVSTSQLVRLIIDYIATTRPTLTIYPIEKIEDKERFKDKKERSWLQMRVSQQERDLLDSVADDYGLDASKFVRVVIGYVRELRPTLALVPKGRKLPPRSAVS